MAEVNCYWKDANIANAFGRVSCSGSILEEKEFYTDGSSRYACEAHSDVAKRYGHYFVEVNNG